MRKSNFTIHCGYEINYEDLSTPVAERAKEFLSLNPSGVIFLNPICTIVADTPSQEYFAVLRKWQAKWCKQASPSIGRQSRRSVARYLADRGRMSKRQRYFERAFAFTGILFVNGQVIQPHRWRKFE